MSSPNAAKTTQPSEVGHEWHASSVVVVAVLTFVLLAMAAFTVIDLVHAREERLVFMSRLQHAQAALLAADERVAHQTRLYLQSAHEHCLDERARAISEFDATIVDLKLSKDLPLVALADEIDTAAAALSAYERQAIELAREGQTSSALALLESPEYYQCKAQLRSKIARLCYEDAPHFQSYAIRHDSALGMALFTGTGVIVLSALAWTAVILRLIHWRHSLITMLRERTEMAEALRLSEERYLFALAGANDGIWDWNLQTNEIFYSARWKWLLGYEDHEISPSPAEWFSRVHSEDRQRFHEAIRNHLDGKTNLLDVELRMVTRDGQWRWMHVRGVAMRDEHQHPVRIAGSLSDITRRKIAEEQLRHGAFHDPLTQLPNRAYFFEFLEKVAARSQRHPEELFAVLFLDLDDFKDVNDNFGHAAGDDCLAQIAARLSSSLRPSDFLARFGGDEFVVLVEDVETPQHIYELARRLEHAVREPLAVAGRHVTVGVSIGIAFSNQEYSDPKDLVALADNRMYQEKSRRKNTSAR